MIEDKSVLALIPARGGSKGLPRKNIRPLCGKPLIAWPIAAALGSRYVDRIVVSTDDEEIAAVARIHGAEAPFLRPAELASDTASSFAVIEHALDFLQRRGEQYDYLLLLEPTSPATEGCDINSAVEKLVASRGCADSIVGVAQAEGTHPAFMAKITPSGLLSPYLEDSFSSAGRRQDLTRLYFLEGTLYLSDVSVLLERKTFYHTRTLPYIVPKWKSFEIDDIVDFICLEAILSKRDVIEWR